VVATETAPEAVHVEHPRVVVAICTYRRNDSLRRLLAALERNAATLGDQAAVGVVVVDDNPDRRAAAVCDEFSERFELGLHYRTAGQGNISVGRNLALEAALPLADWVAMTDDDCEPPDDWLACYLEDQRQFGTDAVTGPCYLTADAGAPRWLLEQPFFEDAQLRHDHGERMALAATNNSFLRAEFFRARPDLRFDPELGVLGGEDMVFFRSAVRDGLTVAFSTRASVYGHESPDRWTFRHQIRSRFWIGNTEWVTNRHLGEATRPWWILRALKAYALAALRPLRRLTRRRPPQIRYAVASAARATGMLAGALGRRVDHH
jgi:succinoglycan biosynthesis protein ExoM